MAKKKIKSRGVLWASQSPNPAPPLHPPPSLPAYPNWESDLFLRRFREGNSFPNFVERATPDLPLSKLCAVPFALLLYRTEHCSRGRKGRNVPRKRAEKGWPAKGAKRKKGTRENRSGINCRVTDTDLALLVPY